MQWMTVLWRLHQFHLLGSYDFSTSIKYNKIQDKISLLAQLLKTNASALLNVIGASSMEGFLRHGFNFLSQIAKPTKNCSFARYVDRRNNCHLHHNNQPVLQQYGWNEEQNPLWEVPVLEWRVWTHFRELL